MSYDVYWVKNRAEKIVDFEHPTLQGVLFIISVYPGRCPGLGEIWAFSPHCLSFDTPSYFYIYERNGTTETTSNCLYRWLQFLFWFKT